MSSQVIQEVYILSAKRTPIGRFRGALASVSASELGAVAVKSAVAASGVNPHTIDEILMGQVLTAGNGQAPARQAALFAGLPNSVAATTVGKVCGSGLKAVAMGAQGIMLGDAHCVVAGGQESMSMSPYLMPGARDGLKMGHKEITDSMIKDGLWDPYNNLHMGSCAESCAKEFSIGREEQDRFSQSSYAKALEAQKTGKFDAEIVPVEVTVGKNKQMVSVDEEPGASDLSKMVSLKPVFDKDGTITAANASKINDGAAALVLASGEYVKRHNLKPLAKIVSYAAHAQEPKWFTTAPVESIRKCLAKANLDINDVDLFEINEAFALVTLAAIKELKIPENKVNVHGGAVALGHPIGGSGARILTTLVHALQAHGKKRGVASLCIGGGEAFSMLVELV
jgi:acetyl-CoA C-acetyltransferase